MDFAYSSKAEELRRRLKAFMEKHVVPAIPAWQQEVAAGVYPPSIMAPLKAEARSAGLWNLFLPALGEDEPGTGLSNLDYAPLDRPVRLSHRCPRPLRVRLLRAGPRNGPA
jgi:acyl-CoA dehydrogenase